MNGENIEKLLNISTIYSIDKAACEQKDKNQLINDKPMTWAKFVFNMNWRVKDKILTVTAGYKPR